MITKEETDQLRQIRDALEKLLDELPPESEDADHISWVRSMLDVQPSEKSLRMMANILLRGYTGLDDRTKYLSRESEGPFRQALAMLLRSNAPLSRHVREELADHIAVDDVAPWPRKIEFGFRQEGKRPDLRFEGAITSLVERHLRDGGTVNDGVEAAIKEFGLEERTVRRYWGRYARAMEEAFGFKMTKPGPKSKKRT
jgi:hypothetical protein